MATRNDPFRTRASDVTTWVFLPVGVLAVGVAFIALVVAGVSVADTFSPAADAAANARDTGVSRATVTWATPLALLGIATLFGVVIPAALARIQTNIRARRDALVASLPRLVPHQASQS